MKKKPGNLSKDELLHHTGSKSSTQKETIPSFEDDKLRLIHELEVHQIELEMQNKELVHARNELETLLGQFTELYDFAPVGYFTLAGDGCIKQANLTGATLLGVERSDLIKKCFGLLVSATSRPVFNAFLEKVFSTSEKQTCEVALLKAESEVIWVHIVAVLDIAHETCRAIVSDITSRKQAEVEMQQILILLEEAQHQAKLGSWEYDLFTQKLTWSQQVYSIFGLDKTCEPTLGGLAEWIHPDDLWVIAPETIEKNTRNGVQEMEYRIIDQTTGEIKYVIGKGRTITDPDGKPIKNLGSFQDITERRRGEDALRESEDSFKYVFDNSITGYSITLISGEVRVNQSFCNMLGYSLEEFKQHKWQDFTHPDDIDLTQREIDALLSGAKKITRFTKRFIHKNGSVVWVEVASSLRRDNDGKPLYLVTSLLDITERKRAEDALRLSEQDLTQAQEIARIGNWKWDIEKGEITWSDEMYRIFGIDKNSYTGRLGDVIARVIHPDDLHIVLPSNASNIANEPVEYRIILPDQSIRYIWARSGDTVFNKAGKPVFLSGIAQDITERKLVEEALRVGNERFNALFYNLPLQGVIYRFIRDARGEIVDWEFSDINALGAASIGKDASELIGKRASDLFGNQMMASYFELSRQVAKTGQTQQFETRFEANGRIYLSAVFLVGTDFYANVSLDITERKQAEVALRESEARLKALIDNTTDAIWSIDAEYKLTSMNAVFRDDLAKFAEREIGNGSSVFIGASDSFIAEWEPLYARALGGERFSYVGMAHGKMGGSSYRETSFNPIHGPSNKVIGVACFSRDITERKQAEDALHESQERLEFVLEGSQLGYWDWNIETGHVRRNERWAEMLGYTLPEIELNVTQWTDLHHPDDRAAAWKSIQDHLEGRTAMHKIEYRMLAKDGQYRWISDCARIVKRDAQGRPLRMSGTHSDITEHRQMEDALKESLNNLNLILSNAPLILSVINLKGEYILLKGKGLSNIGRKPGQLPAETVYEIYRDTPAVLDCIRRAMAGESVTANVNLSGEVLEARYEPLKDQTGVIMGVIALLQIITDRKRAEDQIKKSLAEKDALLRELYHRTRNNMAVIIAMLELQALGFNDESLKIEFTEAQNRIHSMALIHKKLYAANDLSHINLREYINDLVKFLLKSYCTDDPNRISIVTEMEDVFVLIDSAIPFGLILNELISNALKYAFPDGRNGEIRIWLRKTEDGEIELDIADNGAGVPPGFNFHRDGHLGIQNVFMLVENQLLGQVIFDTHQGVACRVKFQDIYYQPRV